MTTTPISAVTLTGMLYLLITQSLYCKNMYGAWIPCQQCHADGHVCDPYKVTMANDSPIVGSRDCSLRVILHVSLIWKIF
jgi:hypothetical protein